MAAAEAAGRVAAVLARIVVSASPLLADGIAAALSAVDGWQAVMLDAGAASDDGADVLVLQWRGDAAVLPQLAPDTALLLLLGDDVPTLAALAQAGTRPLALLVLHATTAQLRAAVAALLQGLSVHDAALPWPPSSQQHVGSDAAAAAAMQSPTPSIVADHEPLTPRELQVYELVGKGLSNRDIGGVLGISQHTAKYHVGQILAKVGAATRAEAVSAGLRMGIIGL